MSTGGAPTQATVDNTQAVFNLTTAVMRVHQVIESKLAQFFAMTGPGGPKANAIPTVESKAGTDLAGNRITGTSAALVNTMLKLQGVFGKLAAMNLPGSKTAGGLLASAAGGARAGAVAGPVGAVAGAGLGVIGKLFSPVTAMVELFGKVVGALTPLAILGATLGAATSGFSVFLSTIGILGATLGTLLLPFFLLLSAAVLTVADYLWSKIVPVLGDYYEAVVGFGIKAVDYFSAALLTARDIALAVWETIRDGAVGLYNGVRTVVNMLFEVVKKIPGGAMLALASPVAALGAAILPELANSMKGAGEAVGDLFEANLKKSQLDRQSGARGKGGKDTLSGMFAGNLKDVIQEMRLQNAPQAQSMGITQASRAAQLAALNMTPFQSRMLDRVQTAIDAIERVAANTNKPPQPAHGNT